MALLYSSGAVNSHEVNFQPITAYYHSLAAVVILFKGKIRKTMQPVVVGGGGGGARDLFRVVF